MHIQGYSPANYYEATPRHQKDNSTLYLISKVALCALACYGSIALESPLLAVVAVVVGASILYDVLSRALVGQFSERRNVNARNHQQQRTPTPQPRPSANGRIPLGNRDDRTGVVKPITSSEDVPSIPSLQGRGRLGERVEEEAFRVSSDASKDREVRDPKSFEPRRFNNSKSSASQPFSAVFADRPPVGARSSERLAQSSSDVSAFSPPSVGQNPKRAALGNRSSDSLAQSPSAFSNFSPPSVGQNPKRAALGARSSDSLAQSPSDVSAFIFPSAEQQPKRAALGDRSDT